MATRQMLSDFLAVRNVSQKWKYEKRFIHTYTKEHIINIMNYYKDMNYFSSSCLLVGTDATGTSGYFAKSCMKISIEAVRYTAETLSKGSYRKTSYYSEGSVYDLDTATFDTQKGLQLPPNSPDQRGT